ncbi:hypothetical protein E2C01_074575 [Portunus trituberculatus]|uniref:Uncharacterized protein n=1 Tax=Portunus trituberculatus TaxID=210409 RepID=A0A5B7I8D0_PORTR|nr:hypothetical protein [Portunus trituberculatus]
MHCSLVTVSCITPTCETVHSICRASCLLTLQVGAVIQERRPGYLICGPVSGAPRWPNRRTCAHAHRKKKRDVAAVQRKIGDNTGAMILTGMSRHSLRAVALTKRLLHHPKTLALSKMI